MASKEKRCRILNFHGYFWVWGRLGGQRCGNILRLHLRTARNIWEWKAARGALRAYQNDLGINEKISEELTIMTTPLCGDNDRTIEPDPWILSVSSPHKNFPNSLTCGGLALMEERHTQSSSPAEHFFTQATAHSHYVLKIRFFKVFTYSNRKLSKHLMAALPP